MKLPRRKFLRLAAGAAAVPALSRGAVALDYPNRPEKSSSDSPLEEQSMSSGA